MTVVAYTGERTRPNVNGEPYELRLVPATVYAFFDADGEALYVGLTTQGIARLGQHGAKAWWTNVASIRVEHFEDRSDASERERYLIRQLDPEHNVAGRIFEATEAA